MSKKGVLGDIFGVFGDILEPITDPIGEFVEGALDVVKDITGANAAEDANKLARDQFEQGKADILSEKELAREKNAAAQLKASNLAGGLRRGRKSSSPTKTASAPALGSDERDFLGL